MRLHPFLLAAAAIPLALSLAGCRIETHKHGDNDDVHIGTPFGSMHVKTDDASVLAGLGLTPYPGAVAVHKKDDDGAVNMHIGFGNFKLGVRALELQTVDGQDKVLAFYRKDMNRYGAVITCRGTRTIGEPARTAEGLDCDSKNHGNEDEDPQLRAGSPQHQHIVSVKSEDGGTRIALVALDLPGDSRQSSKSDDDRE